MIKPVRRITSHVTPEISISNFSGVDLMTSPTLLGDGESTEMINMQLDSKGMLQRFTGYDAAFTLFEGANTRIQWIGCLLYTSPEPTRPY